MNLSFGQLLLLLLLLILFFGDIPKIIKNITKSIQTFYNHLNNLKK